MGVSGSVGAEEGAKTAGEAAAADAGAAGAADVAGGAAAADVAGGAAAADVGAGAAAADAGAGAASAAEGATLAMPSASSGSTLGDLQDVGNIYQGASGLSNLGSSSADIYGNVGGSDLGASASSMGINSSTPTFGSGASGLGLGSENSALSDLSGADSQVVSDSAALPSSADSASAPASVTPDAVNPNTSPATNAATGTITNPPADVSNAAAQSASAATLPSTPATPVSNDILDTDSAQNGTPYGTGTGSGADNQGSNSSITSALKQLGAYGKTALSVGKDVAGIATPIASLLMAKKAQTAATTTGATAQNQLNAIAAPASAVSNQLLTNYQSGTLSTADQQSIAQYGQQQQAQIKQYYANAGLSNSSMEASALAQVGVQQNQMMQQALNNELSGGLSAAGVAQGPQLAGVTAATTADQQSQQAMTNFMQTLAKMYSSSGSSNSSS